MPRQEEGELLGTHRAMCSTGAGAGQGCCGNKKGERKRRKRRGKIPLSIGKCTAVESQVGRRDQTDVGRCSGCFPSWFHLVPTWNIRRVDARRRCPPPRGRGTRPPVLAVPTAPSRPFAVPLNHVADETTPPRKGLSPADFHKMLRRISTPDKCFRNSSGAVSRASVGGINLDLHLPLLFSASLLRPAHQATSDTPTAAGENLFRLGTTTSGVGTLWRPI